jgi:flagellar protein FlgJ
MANTIGSLNTINGFDNAYVPLSGRRENVTDARSGFDSIMAKTKKASDALNTAGENTADKNKAGIDKADKLYEQCAALETFIVINMISGMRKTVMKADLIDTGFAGEVYEDMLWDEYAKEYTKASEFGLAELAYLELTGQRGKKIPM